MRIKEDGSFKGITISKDYVRGSYEQGHYVEAIVLTHYIIGVNMNRTFDTIRHIHHIFKLFGIEVGLNQDFMLIDKRKERNEGVKLSISFVG